MLDETHQVSMKKERGGWTKRANCSLQICDDNIYRICMYIWIEQVVQTRCEIIIIQMFRSLGDKFSSFFFRNGYYIMHSNWKWKIYEIYDVSIYYRGKQFGSIPGSKKFVELSSNFYEEVWRRERGWSKIEISFVIK